MGFMRVWVSCFGCSQPLKAWVRQQAFKGYSLYRLRSKMKPLEAALNLKTPNPNTKT